MKRIKASGVWYVTVHDGYCSYTAEIKGTGAARIQDVFDGAAKTLKGKITKKELNRNFKS